MGGLDSRYMISNLSMRSKVASLTTLNSPHRGSPIANIIDRVIADWLKPFVGTVIDSLTALLYGYGSQESLEGLASLTTAGMDTFNQYTPNARGKILLLWQLHDLGRPDSAPIASWLTACLCYWWSN